MLVRSKTEDGCMDVLRAHGNISTHNLDRIYPSFLCLVDASDGTFQVRPHKDFIPTKGRDRVLSLRLLMMLPAGEPASNTLSSASSDSEPRNAYDFMRRRRDASGDPTSQKWNAAIRLANYASIEGSPLCVSKWLIA